jgi:UDP-glucose 4-epimerase
MALTVLITGASGTLGTALTAWLALHSSDARLICLSRAELTDPPAGIVSINGDFADREVLARLSSEVGKVDVCVHLAGCLSEGNGEDFQLAVNVVGTHALMTHLRDNGTEKFVLASSIAAVGCLSPEFRPVQLPMPDDHNCLDPLGYGGSKYLMEEMSRLVSRQNPALDIINLRIAGILGRHEDTPPAKPPGWAEPPVADADGASGQSPAIVGFGLMYQEDMMRCLKLSIDAPLKPGVRVLNAVAQHATIAEGRTVSDVLREWWGADVADAIPGLSHYDQPGHGDDSIFDTKLCHEEIGFLSEQRVEVEPSPAAKL